MSEKLLKKFDRLLSSGNLHINMARNMDPRDISDEDKIKLMKVLNKINSSEEA